MDLAVTSLSPSSAGAYSQPRRADDRDDSEQTASAKPADDKKAAKQQLTPADRQLIAELQSRDREVHAHEGAHKAVGGALVGNATFSYQTGPDGRRYAIGGEVSIDSGAEREPRATIAKMQRVVAAALAPAEPSAQDRSVAGQARSTMANAQMELNRQIQEESSPLAKAYNPTGDETGGMIDTTA
jgi:hypothetical protein